MAMDEWIQMQREAEMLKQEIVRQHDRIRELEEERDRARSDRDRLSAELQRVVVDEHLDVPPLEAGAYDYLQVEATK